MQHRTSAAVLRGFAFACLIALPSLAAAQARVSLFGEFYGERKINFAQPVKTSLCLAAPTVSVGRAESIFGACRYVADPVWGSFVDTMRVQALSNAITGSPEIRTRSFGTGAFTPSRNDYGEYAYTSSLSALFQDTLLVTQGAGASFFRFTARLTGNIGVDPQRCTIFGCAPPTVLDPGFQGLVSNAYLETTAGTCSVGGTGVVFQLGGVGLVSNLLVCDVPIRALVNGRLGFGLGFNQQFSFARNDFGGNILPANYTFDLDFMNTMKIEQVQAFDAQNTDLTARYGFSYVGLANVNVVPEPMTTALLGAGLAALGLVEARRRRGQPDSH